MKMKSFLEAVTINTHTHARWLNSLSYLEYRGFRKIARALETQDINTEILSHVMEEARHALYFKKLAIKVGGKTFDSYENSLLLSPQALRKYYFNLDFEINQTLKTIQTISHRKAVYQFVTWLIEVRAMKLYQCYSEILMKHGFSFSLNPILSDEMRHLEEVSAEATKVLLQSNINPNLFASIEEKHFEELIEVLERELNITEHIHA